ncbi:Six-hairpin glycosidase-like protein [Podospora australis]|uniref:Six-hairpin glycosidase-like protein n=1 Tax=Podospora australis TaxID=1536484 RepID=A0AAN6X3E5_9PEZI|nr:Six-hairpin glycosidase-like protein [Podospora australis]
MWPRRKKKWVSIRNVWVNCTAFPSQKNGRAYSGYFYSSNEMLNRIWYSGAWTLQLSTIDPKEGGALIDFNRIVDGNDSPIGSWYSNFTISNGTAVTTDGAKRDRMVYPGDMFVAVPGIAVSTFDMAAVRNALEVLFDHQYGDGSLPYAGPPMGLHGEFSDTYHMHTLLGVYHYVLYSGDVEWLRKRWEAYQRALKISVDKVDKMGLMHVSSTADWLRPGMTGHNLEATSILYTVLDRSKLLAQWVGQPGDSRELNIGLTAVQKRLENGVARLYCPASGLFADNIGERGCLSPKGPVLPQDGNSWVLLSNMDLSPCRYPWKDPKSPFRSNHTLKNAPTRKEVSNLLRGRWTKYGAPAVEFPNTISPFASSFELLGHVYAGNEDYAVELMLVEWGYLLDGPGFTNSTLAEGFRIDGHMQYPAYWSAARNSHTHGWSAGPTGVLMEYILGIRLLAPGGTSWVYYGGLTVWLSSVQGGFHGTKDRWWQLKKWRVTTKSGDKKGVVAEVTAPAGTEGRISLGDEELKVVGNGQPKIFVRMEGDGESIQSIDIKQKTVTVEGGENTEDWYQNIVLTMDDGTELLFDTDWKEPEVEEREVGVVDWEVMEKHFKTPPPEGWRMDRLRVQGDEW